MKNWKRLLSMLLCMLILHGSLQMNVFAVESDIETLYHYQNSTAWPGQPKKIPITLSKIPAQKHILNSRDRVYHTDSSTAATELREAMAERADSVTIGYLIPSSQYTNEGVQALFDATYYAAKDHTGVPYEGDSLNVCWVTSIRLDYMGSTQNARSYYVTMTMTLDSYTSAVQEQVLDKEVNALLKNLSPTGTDYEKIKTVYDWICTNITYDYDNLEDESYVLKYTAYAALVDRTAVCQGYALLMYRLALEMGIDCRYIRGYGYGERHGWNIVKIGDVYYNLDATWDAGSEGYDYFMKNDSDFLNHTRDAEFSSNAFYTAYPMSQESYCISTGICGDNIEWILDNEGVLLISGNGALSVECEGGYLPPWWRCLDRIVSVIVEPGVTGIGTFAFIYCENLTSVVLPESVHTIEMYAVYECNALTDLYYAGDENAWSMSGGNELSIPYVHVNCSDYADHWILESTATCTEPGVQSGACSCGYVRSGIPVPALGHTFGDWIVTVKPTTTSEGEQVRFCQNEGCSHYERESIPQIEQIDGWAEEDGQWVFYKNGEKVKNQWLKSGYWYHFDADGYMETNAWIKSGSKWCYVDSSGRMIAGKWQQIGSKWYYFNSSGYMTTGWQSIGGKWYYMGSDGVMKTGWQSIGGKWYYMGSDGAMKTGWQSVGGKWYYLNSYMMTGWQRIGGSWYYLGSDGAMRTNWQQISGSWYYLGSNGAMRTGWLKLGSNWYYLGSDGAMRTGTHVIDGKTYKFNSNGVWIG